MSRSELIRLEGVSFSYPRRSPCLEDVSIEISDGSVLFLGANGAGKSTLLRLMSGQCGPAAGRRVVHGSIGYMPQHVPRIPGFTVEEQVAYCGWLAGLSRQQASDAVAAQLNLVGMSALADRRVETLSGGELARTGIAGALIANAQFLLLDEPSAALDPIARRNVHESLQRVAETGVVVIAASHTGSDLGPPFERVVLLDRGRVHFDGGRRSFLRDEHDDPVVKAMASALMSGVAGYE